MTRSGDIHFNTDFYVQKYLEFGFQMFPNVSKEPWTKIQWNMASELKTQVHWQNDKLPTQFRSPIWSRVQKIQTIKTDTYANSQILSLLYVI